MRKITGIKAISFDGDQTLWDFKKVMRHSLGFVMIELEKADPIAASRLDIDKMIKIRNRVAEELKGKIANLEVVRLEAFKQTLKDAGRPDDTLAAHLNELYLKHRFEDIELYEDVLPTLLTLKKKYALGLLSNGNGYPERCGLDNMFQFVVFSQDCGVEKPAPEFYHIAVKKSGFLKEELLHIGDSIEKDVIGADKAGIRSVWLNRERRKPDSKVKIDYEIYDLSELLGFL
jgi:HAD superfamily hydrolase (TIGR01509 family)